MDHSPADTDPAAWPDPGAPWVVAVGASAGGLEPLQAFFGALKAPTGAAFVVLQHLSPDHRSLMPDLLAPHCALPVVEAVDGQALEADRVYMMPPGVWMTLAEQRLVFEARPARGLSLPIDRFFTSLSQVCPQVSVGVVLSGSGADGALGGQALQRAGGFVMAQQPDTAQFDSMPRALMEGVRVDACAPPADLAARVLALTQGRAGRVAREGLVEAPSARTALQRIFAALLEHCGLDFGQYKLPTVMRRIERRMQELGEATLDAYADIVDRSVDECDALRSELLIPVTQLFRDPEAFEATGREIESLVRALPEGQPLRIWSAGCATGEEPYSLAILALEACERAGRWPPIKVFGTDVDQSVLDLAATGTYPLTAGVGLAPDRVARHFTVVDECMVVRPELRRLVLFARHNLLDDPPFTRIDLVVCRNTLIYLQAPAQERVMRRLQYALNPQGCLFLGSSESLGALQGDFQIVDAAHKLYRLVRPVVVPFASGGYVSRAVSIDRQQRLERTDAQDKARRLVEAAQRRILQLYAPLCLLMTAQRQLIHAWGPTQRYLRLSEGTPRLDAINLLPARLSTLVGRACHVALDEGREVVEPPVTVDLHGEPLLVRVRAVPVQDARQPDMAVLVTIDEVPVTGEPVSLRGGQASPESVNELDRLGSLERELADTRLSLQGTIEDLEAANEELQATNEELMSSNEELQSTNEELQSVNEELHTVNAEYNAKLEAVTSLNADLDGMSQSTGIATLFVDRALNLLRFTPEAALMFRFRPGDIGRSVADFNNPLDHPDFIHDLQAVLAGGPCIEREVPSRLGGTYIVRILGYGEALALPRRAVVSLIDVSRLHDAQRLQSVLDAVPAHVAVLDVNGTIVQVNQPWLAFARDNGGQARHIGIGTNYLAVLARSTAPGALEVLRGLQQVLMGREARYNVVYPCHSPDEDRWFAMCATRCDLPGGGAVVTHVDITPWHARLSQPPERSDG